MDHAARRPTLADVASRAGTSTAVVSYVVNNGPRAVAPATRERVEQAIRDLGYRRDPIAGALSKGRSNLVGLLVPDTANGFFGELSRCFEVEGRRRGFMTLLGNTGYDDAVSEHYLSGFSDLRPRGIFAMSMPPGAALPKGVPVVFIHSVPEGVTAPSVRFDDLAGARTAVEHLIAHGYTDVHCLAGSGSGDPVSLREQGWRQAMDQAGLDTEGRVHRSSFDRVVVEADMRRMLAERPWPRAVFATTDEQALAVLRAATAVGARVPEDIALAGFDGIREATLGGVRLTTVRVPMEQLATRAFEILEGLSTTSPATGSTTGPGAGSGAEDGGSAEHLVFAGELIIGETCGCESGEGVGGERSFVSSASIASAVPTVSAAPTAAPRAALPLANLSAKIE